MASPGKYANFNFLYLSVAEGVDNVAGDPVPDLPVTDTRHRRVQHQQDYKAYKAFSN